MPEPFWHPNRIWYQAKHPLSVLLLPLSWLFCTLVKLRRFLYQKAYLRSHQAAVPIIVVGNLTVGGGGKTPMVVWLTQQLQKQGYTPGIISRGYSGQSQTWPQTVSASSDPHLVGDEPVLMAQRTNCPLVVGPNRPVAVSYLLASYPCDILISDDGLQHYPLRRDIEILMLNGHRRYGNQRCLPAGPLREPMQRISQVNFIVVGETNNKTAHAGEWSAQRLLGDAHALLNGQKTCQLSDFSGKTVHAVAGIAQPQDFFTCLSAAGIQLITHAFPDHYQYQKADLDFADDFPILMTEKDAVKCQTFASAAFWFVPLEIRLPDHFIKTVLASLHNPRNSRHG
ncbi:tetraacyldisaccharide 4'-kinase [Candidatus Venteria ishoeyi]|uniref:Tetraacyldisaccharide 4'-kinase n=1 Tax=Candidatus Venteria ishoeyi TaxID=1899563 RepID=A0A1H6FA24_9GAMM|nr:tetraacyldisaccharide 4'-kinase [Candidatus Venteria ishoeyi]SEH06221.1 Tetraacyldisaccharide 4'-kinase [Candidatus Venteria ishoeyi]